MQMNENSSSAIKALGLSCPCYESITLITAYYGLLDVPN
jgi:hypothetical protein